MYYKYLKRAIDLFISITSLVLFSWLFLLICITIKMNTKGPIFFKQRRVGIGKTFFYILKFRTMNIDTPQDMPTHLLEQPDKYITKVGKVLRKTSLDELPQLWNILKGQMSFVGPRPALWNQTDLIAKRDYYGANDVLPGLTGWAQINGRDELPIELKAKLDGEYVERVSLFLDIEILLKTGVIVLTSKGFREGSKNIYPK